MSNILAALASDRGRKFIYRLGTAVILLIASYGFIEGDKIALWTGLLAAVTELAAANVPAPGAGEHRPETVETREF